MKTIKHLYMLLAVILLATLPATAQNTNDNKNKAIIETTDGNRELNTDDIQRIRFDGGKITVVHANGETTFDRTLRSLSFQRPNPGTLRLTATTSIGTEGGNNRAQAIEDGKLKATWAEGDVVYVYADASTTTSIGTLTPKTYGDKTATLTGDINATGLTDGQTLYFSTKDRATLDLSTQDGTVESLFYFTATAEVTIDGGNASIEDLIFTRPIAIVKFTLKDKATSNAISATSLNVVADGTAYSVTPTAATDFLFVGIPAIGGKTVSLTAFDGSKAYTYSKSNVSFSNNSYYAINVKMTEDAMLATPLTLEAKTAGTIDIYNPQSGMQYTKNGGAKTTMTGGNTSIDVAVGDIVQFYGNGTSITSYADTYINGSADINGSAECYIYGNIMSLVDEGSYATNTTLTADYTFVGLFYNNSHIYNHSTYALLLPATTLTQGCYSGTFSGCKGLTTAPALPATTLADNCYSYMFKGCTNLTTAPALPATTLALSCYNSMFADCTSLTTAPTLPAETLADNCYSYMFNGCSSLNSITCLATSIVPGQATDYWLENVAATGTFNKASSMESWTTDASGIPSGWTVINDGVLPGQFTVNAGGGKVSFSMGSLQYQANSTGATSAPYTGVWRFAGHQYDNIGADNKNISESYTGWIDLFGWGTSGYAHRTSDYQPWSHTQTNETFIAYNSLIKNLYDEDGKADWGYNAISNGGNTENSGWRTPKNDEWGYLFNTRTTTSGIRYAKATVNGVTGVILLPDDWDASYYALNNTNVAYATWSSNVITLLDWGSKLEAHGAVFLPTSGNRDSNHAPTSGFVNIWSSDNDDSDNAHCVFIPEASCNPTDHAYRYAGLIVRLVKNNIGAGSISYATSEVNKLSVDAAFTNELTLEGDGTVTYAVSSGDDICSVNENTGEVTLNGTAGTCTITATVADSPFFVYAPTSASYTLTVKTMLQIPLTFEAKNAGATVEFTSTMDTAPTIEYSTDGTTWNTYTSAITLANVGDKVSFRGDNETYATAIGKNSSFSCSDDCYLYGNIMSLISKEGYPTATTLTSANNEAFFRLFYNNTHIVNHDEKDIVLPATTLSSGCYSHLFYGCTGLTTAPALPATTLSYECYGSMFMCSGLTTAPELPATTLAELCYVKMFVGCTGLTSAPELPATMLANECYRDMFRGCTNLTTAPELPATTLAPACYQRMFQYCTNLNSVTCLATDISATNCTDDWLSGVTATGTFYKPTSTDWGEPGASSIPSGWTVINDGVLPGQFTVNAGGGKVSFSMGNLRYQANSTGATEAPYTGVWRFAGHQYEAIGSGSSNVSASYDGWIDYFGWGSGNQPTQTSENPNVYSTFVDWGTNAISNGGNTANLWRTLSESEWTYLIFTRPNASSKRGRATVEGMYCYVLLPDDWTLPTGLSFTPNANNWTNVYTTEQWAQMEAAGAVCLPASGSRAGGANNTNINNFNEWGCYWSSTSANSSQGYNLWITSDHVGTTDKGNYQMGASVRLVQNIIGAGSISYATTAVNKLMVDAAFINTLTKVGDGTVTYARSDGAEICTVDENTGEVTLNGTIGTCTITATVTDGSFYTYATTTASYTLTVTSATYLQTPLTFEAKNPGAVVTFTSTLTTPATVEYSKNGSAWTTYTEPITLTNVGDKVAFRGNKPNYATSESAYSSFSCSDDCYLYGNIMSLINKTNYATNTQLTASHAFRRLFYNNAKIYIHQTKQLKLPATSLTLYCYSEMFSGCTGLTSIPALPATIMRESCYDHMFYGCTGITSVPNMPATALAQYCYSYMFSGCTSLTSAPLISTQNATTAHAYCCQYMFAECTSLTSAPPLYATTLVAYCYDHMFSGCTSLTTVNRLYATILNDYCCREMFSGCTSLAGIPNNINMLPATSLAPYCYQGMFKGCSNLSSVPVGLLPATQLGVGCYKEMFKNCTSMTIAPTLSATGLPSYCYQEMFYGCSRLSTVRCGATGGIARNNSTTSWLHGVASKGDFYKSVKVTYSGSDTKWPKNSEDGVPSGWTANDL